ncbi:MAG: hypothetical protein A4S14_10390 [Proteobacteria bacterium SG_bin9]|nr:MAG: hypothetical protein A4S14_10390 [Proteobacteria bacterium SG_bin9]
MLGGKRIGTYNGFLLAAYFVPVWMLGAWRIWQSPIQGLYDRTNIATAIFVSDHLHLSSLGTVRFAWLLALAKVTVAIFLMVFVALSARKAWRDNGGGEEALAIALTLGVVVSFAGMLLASKVGEAEALRLHATETMLLLGGAIVLLVQPQAAKFAAAAENVLPLVQPASSPSS